MGGKYKVLEYLESNGTQYIDTNFIPNQNTKIEIRGNYMTSGECYLASSEIAYNNTAFGIFSSGGYATSTWGNEVHLYCEPFVGDYFTFTNDKGEAEYAFSNGQKHTNSYTKIDFTCAYTFYLFALHRASILTSGTTRIYYCKLWDNGNLVRNIIPVIRIKDGVLGMYDLCEKVFYKNIGTGTFIGGAETGEII